LRLILPRLPCSTLFPYTTLFRSIVPSSAIDNVLNTVFLQNLLCLSAPVTASAKHHYIFLSFELGKLSRNFIQRYVYCSFYTSGCKLRRRANINQKSTFFDNFF